MSSPGINMAAFPYDLDTAGLQNFFGTEYDVKKNLMQNDSGT